MLYFAFGLRRSEERRGAFDAYRGERQRDPRGFHDAGWVVNRHSDNIYIENHIVQSNLPPV
jgi:hypothetical protein